MLQCIRQQCRVPPGGAVDFRDGERLLAPGDTPGSLGWPGREEARRARLHVVSCGSVVGGEVVKGG